ncbi:MAG: hypothetical protein ACT6SV_22690, partial [Agrobacterium sp.]
MLRKQLWQEQQQPSPLSLPEHHPHKQLPATATAATGHDLVRTSCPPSCCHCGLPACCFAANLLPQGFELVPLTIE